MTTLNEVRTLQLGAELELLANDSDLGIGVRNLKIWLAKAAKDIEEG